MNLREKVFKATVQAKEDATKKREGQAEMGYVLEMESAFLKE